MIKKTFIFFFFIFLISANAEIIEKLEVVGNDRISAETIKVYGEIKIGNDYLQSDLNDILKKLYSTDFFENIEIILNNKTIKIIVKEYNIINSINIDGEKSKNIKDKILELINLRTKGSFISNYLNDDINLIKKLYSSLGYNFVKIDYNIEQFSNNRVNLKFNIIKGERTFINKIIFIGDKKIRENKLKDIIVSEEKKFWKILSKNTYFNQNTIDLDKRLLINYYKSLGYYDAQVLTSTAQLKKNNTTDITFTINAGKRYRINKISTNVSDPIDKKLFEPMQKFYLNLVGKYYSPFKVKKLLDEIDFLIAANDLQFIDHTVNEILTEDKVEIIINVFEGPKKTVERINILGNTVTEESVIRSELLVDEGDPFSNLKFNKSIAKLKSRNLFGEVNANIFEGSSKDLNVIEIKVEEKPTGEISAGAGIGTNGASFAFDIAENNWLGKGINVATSFDVSSETFTGSLSLTDPNYNFSGNSLNYIISNTKNDKPDSGYENNLITLGVGTKFEQYRDVFLTPGLRFSYDDLKVEDSASNALKKQKGTFSDLSFDYAISTDKRDRVYGPTEGYFTSFSQTIPLYADSPFLKNSFSYNKYLSFNPNVIGAFKFYLAGINGLNDKDVRLSKRLSLSSSRLRGFESGKVGPKDGVDFIGGNYVASSNIELNLPNLLPESTKTDVGLFLDFANIWGVDYSESLNDSNKVRSSVGINTSWLSPVGPMSFVFSQNLSKAETDITESFNFRLGTTF